MSALADGRHAAGMDDKGADAPSRALASDVTLQRRFEGGRQRHLRPSFAAGLGALSEGIERLAAAWSAYHADPAEPLEASAPPAML